jgi:hypothetical protein
VESLELFLHPVEREHEKFVVSDRFVDQEGQAVAWELRPVTAEENDYLMRRNTKQTPSGNHQLDESSYRHEFTAAGVVWPNLDDAALQQHYGVMGRSALLKKMLLAGEMMALYRKVSALSGFGKENKSKVEEIKNA